MVFHLRAISALKIVAEFSSETSVRIYKSARHQKTTRKNFHIHRCENLKSHTVSSLEPTFLTITCVPMQRRDGGKSAGMGHAARLKITHTETAAHLDQTKELHAVPSDVNLKIRKTMFLATSLRRIESRV
jgi:hypothetical protein